MTDQKVDKETKEVGHLMHESMKEVYSNTMLLNIIYKTGRTTRDTQNDFRKGMLTLFRDEVIAITIKHVMEMIEHEQHKNPTNPLSPVFCIARLASFSHQELNASFNNFRHLYTHLRQEHKEEIMNEAKKLGVKCEEWEDT